MFARNVVPKIYVFDSVKEEPILHVVLVALNVHRMDQTDIVSNDVAVRAVVRRRVASGKEIFLGVI